MNHIVSIGIDLAKNVFVIYGVNATGSPCWCVPAWLAAHCLDSSPLYRRA